ncbi:MAG: helix-turn-helix domain-containing protein [Thermocrispum sp.]
MDFPAALGAAIASSGRSLDELAEELKGLGTPASASALSTWQTGTSQPERIGSLAALTNLERILGLPERGLRDLLPPRRPRGRRRADPASSDSVTLWERLEPIERLLAKLDATPADLTDPAPLSSRYLMLVDGNGHEREMRLTRIVQAGPQGARRVLFMTRYHSLPQAPRLTRSIGCELSRFRGDADSRFAVFEFALEEPLGPREITMIEFGIRYPPAQSDMFTDVRVRPGVRDLAVEVRFDPARLPEHCETFYQSDVDAERRTLKKASGRAVRPSMRLVEIDPSPGIYGLTWSW